MDGENHTHGRFFFFFFLFSFFFLLWSHPNALVALCRHTPQLALYKKNVVDDEEEEDAELDGMGMLCAEYCVGAVRAERVVVDEMRLPLPRPFCFGAQLCVSPRLVLDSGNALPAPASHNGASHDAAAKDLPRPRA